MTELIVGIKHIRDDVETQSVIGAEMSVIGLIGTAPNADNVAFPVNTNVLLYTNDSALRAKLGSAGTLEDALKGISAQLGVDTGAARVVVRRVHPGIDALATIANIVGSESARTGLWGFLDAPEELGLTPRILLAPGFTSQFKTGVKSVVVTDGGSGYTSAPTVAFTGGSGTGAAATAEISNGVGSVTGIVGGTGYSVAPVVTISAPNEEGGVQATATAAVTTGAVSSVTITNPGSGYTVPPTITFGGPGTGAAATAVLTGIVSKVTLTNGGQNYASAPTIAFSGGGGTDAEATASVGQLANAVCAIIPTIADRLRGVFIPEGPSSSRQAWLDWLETVPRSMRILHPLAQDAKVIDANGDVVTRPLSPYIAGRYVNRDNGDDGVPAHSVANQPLNGLVGVTPSIPLSIIDPSSIGQDYLERSAGIVVRGESGVEGSLTSGGYTFWGTDTLSETSSYLFANVMRLRDYIELTQVKAEKKYLGAYNLTVQTVQAIYNTMDGILAKLKADGFIIDYRLSYEEGRNTAGELRLGNLDITFEAEEPPVLRKITIRSRRYPRALEALSQQLSIAIGGSSDAIGG